MAETRPDTLDAMANISGVGAKKLERYGKQFLEVITGEIAPDAHPSRRKLAGSQAAGVYDRLLAAQADLARGEGGTGKPMRCSTSDLANVAETRPANLDAMSRILGPRHTDRFGSAFLDALQDA